MRILGYLILVLITAVAASYWPLTSYLPPKDTVIETVRTNAPFLADWIPESSDSDSIDEADSVSSALRDSEETEDSTIVEASESIEGTDQEIWYEFDIDEIELLLTEMGAEPEMFVNEDATSYVISERPDAYSFSLYPKLCEEGGTCLGLSISSMFDIELSPAQLTTLSDRYAYMKFYSSENNALVLQKYITADYGIARGNVRINILTYMDILDNFEDVLSE